MVAFRDKPNLIVNYRRRFLYFSILLLSHLSTVSSSSSSNSALNQHDRTNYNSRTEEEKIAIDSIDLNYQQDNLVFTASANNKEPESIVSNKNFMQGIYLTKSEHLEDDDAAKLALRRQVQVNHKQDQNKNKPQQPNAKQQQQQQQQQPQINRAPSSAQQQQQQPSQTPQYYYNNPNPPMNQPQYIYIDPNTMQNPNMK